MISSGASDGTLICTTIPIVVKPASTPVSTRPSPSESVRGVVPSDLNNVTSQLCADDAASSIVSGNPPLLRTLIGACTVSPGSCGKYPRGPMSTPGGGTVVVNRAVFDFDGSFEEVNVASDVSESPEPALPGTVTFTTTSTVAPDATVPVSGIESPFVSLRGVVPSALYRATAHPRGPGVPTALKTSG